MSWWKDWKHNDIFKKMRERDNKPSRAYYKLEEMDQKYNIIRKKDLKVLDLGASPGGWCAYLLTKTKNITAVDLLPMKIEVPEFHLSNIFDFETDKKFDLVLSDIAPNLTGNKFIDSCAMFYISERIAYFCKNKPIVLMKFFEGSEAVAILDIFKKMYKNIKVIKPISSRKESAEKYLYCYN